mmetsp:Transcript_6113/g.19963  ORF Transcript_6113/g.19963 Transcript_6113/m.19963 type:complete len:217 (-) Transcript_6113:469-1119(-)
MNPSSRHRVHVCTQVCQLGPRHKDWRRRPKLDPAASINRDDDSAAVWRRCCHATAQPLCSAVRPGGRCPRPLPTARGHTHPITRHKDCQLVSEQYQRCCHFRHERWHRRKGDSTAKAQLARVPVAGEPDTSLRANQREPVRRSDDRDNLLVCWRTPPTPFHGKGFVEGGPVEVTTALRWNDAAGIDEPFVRHQHGVSCRSGKTVHPCEGVAWLTTT